MIYSQESTRKWKPMIMTAPTTPTTTTMNTDPSSTTMPTSSLLDILNQLTTTDNSTRQHLLEFDLRERKVGNRIYTPIHYT